MPPAIPRRHLTPEKGIFPLTPDPAIPKKNSEIRSQHREHENGESYPQRGGPDTYSQHFQFLLMARDGQWTSNSRSTSPGLSSNSSSTTT
jgi:hypothetical protein